MNTDTRYCWTHVQLNEQISLASPLTVLWVRSVIAVVVYKSMSKSK